MGDGAPYSAARIRVSVSGMLFETLGHTYEKYPTTLLGDKDRRAPYYDESINAYFFDRNRQCFQAILNYYQSGRLERPSHIPMYLFERELLFYDLGAEVIKNLRAREGFKTEEEAELPENAFQRKVWELFEIPDSSKAAKMIAFWSVLVILASVVTFCLETVKEEHHHDDESAMENFIHQHKAIFYSPSWEIFCATWFTFEYVIRLISSPNKLKFVKSPLNIVDLIAVLPYLISHFLDEESSPLAVLRIVRLTRIFRIFKLSRYFTGLQVLAQTMQASIYGLTLLILLLIIGVVFFATATFLVEHEVDVSGHEQHFISIPSAFWYSFVTMTTVGYGDETPETHWGRLFGTVCVMSGILVVGLVVPVIVTNFEHFYKREITDKREKCQE